MSRIPPASIDAMSPRTQADCAALAAYGPFQNWAGIAAQSPVVLHQVTEMLVNMRAETALPRRVIELAMVAVSQLNACDYCLSHHVPSLKVTGLSPEGVARLLEEKNPELDARDKAVVHYACAVTERSGRMRDAEVTDLRQWFDEGQIVELTWRIALGGAFNRFNDALQIEAEEPLETDVA